MLLQIKVNSIIDDSSSYSAPNAMQYTWDNAKSYVVENNFDVCRKDQLVDFFSDYGMDTDELEESSDIELHAMLVQLIAGDYNNCEDDNFYTNDCGCVYYTLDLIN